MHRWSFCEWIPILPRPVWPLAGQCGLGQNRVVGSMVCLLLWRCWAACQEGVCQDPIYIPTEPHHGLVESYHFITTHELPPLLAAAEVGGAVILPVIVSPSQFERIPHLSQFQAVNPPSQPLVNMAGGEREAVF